MPQGCGNSSTDEMRLSGMDRMTTRFRKERQFVCTAPAPARQRGAGPADDGLKMNYVRAPAEIASQAARRGRGGRA